MTTHDLKILPKYFAAVKSGKKTFEVRKKDRDYRVGDYLDLIEYNEALGCITGDGIRVQVVYIMDEPAYCKDGYVILGFRVIGSFIAIPTKLCWW